MRSIALAFAMAIALSAPHGSLRAQDALLDKAVAAYNNIRTARGTFAQTITNALTGTTVRSRGTFVQQMSPVRFAFLFTQPSGDRIIADGSWVWVYLPSTNPDQVIRMPASEGTAGNLDLAAQFFDSPRTRYEITPGGSATVGGHATRALVLEPRSGNGTFTRATIWVDVKDGTLRQFETEEPSGLTRRVEITEWKVNVPVDAASFRFTPPKNARIVNPTGAR